MCISCEVDTYLYKLFKKLQTADCYTDATGYPKLDTAALCCTKLQRTLTFRNQQFLTWLIVYRSQNLHFKYGREYENTLYISTAYRKWRREPKTASNR